MKARQAVYTAGFEGITAAAIALAAPYRPQLTRLPADWPETQGITVSVHPSGAVYAGDRVSVTAAADADPGGRKLQLRVDRADGAPLAESPFFKTSHLPGWQAQLAWVWDSSGGDGWHTLYLTLSGEGAGSEPVRYPVRVLPAEARPAPRRSAAWREAEGACCDFHYLTGTEAERDINEIKALAEAAFVSINAKLGGTATPALRGQARVAQTKLALVFLPRVYGQGGLAIQEGYLSYTDRNYTGTDFRVVLEHELNHLMTIARYGDGLRAPIFFQEGWAVYLTGGHYRAGESLAERAAALIALGRFTPLSALADSFSAAQHEAAYIEAGAFVDYLAGLYGRDRVTKMLFDPARSGSPSGAMDAMLQAQLGCTLAECEADWLAALSSTIPGPETMRDVEFTMEMFDQIRDYQQAYAEGVSMYDLFLPDPARARADRITADFLAPPVTADAAALELMFLAARDAADDGQWALARGLLAAIGQVLDAKARRAPDPAGIPALAGRYRDLAAAILRAGGEPLRIEFAGDEALALTRNPLSLEKEAQRWILIHGDWARSA